MSHKNLLTLNEQEINIIQELWEVSGTNSIVRSITQYKQAPASLLLSNTSGTSSECNLIRLLNLAANTQYRIFVFGYSDTDQTVFGVRATTYDVAGVEETTHTSISKTAYSKWEISSVIFTTGQDTKSMVLELYAEGAPVWFDQVVVVPYYEKPYHRFTNLVTTNFPDYMNDVDEQESYHLARFVDAVGELGDDILTAVLAFDYIPAVDGVPGYDRCSLVDPAYYPDDTVAKSEWLPWLAQLVGVRGVLSGSSGQTPWFWLENEYDTWSGIETEIDPTSNPVWPSSSFSRTDGVVTATLGTQTSGSPYFPAIGDVVEVTNSGDFSGSYSILTSNSGTQVLTWAQDAANGTSTAVSSLRVSDTSWAEIEADNPLAFDTTRVLAHLVRTRATGLRAGTDRSISAAVISVLDGFDSEAIASITDDGILVTTVKPHPFAPGDFVAIYDSDNPVLEVQSTIDSVVGPTSFVIVSTMVDRGYGEVKCWATNKRVVVEHDSPHSWGLTVLTDEAQTLGVDLVLRAANLAKPAGAIVSHGYNT